MSAYRNHSGGRGTQQGQDSDRLVQNRNEKRKRAEDKDEEYPQNGVRNRNEQEPPPPKKRQGNISGQDNNTQNTEQQPGYGLNSSFCRSGNATTNEAPQKYRKNSEGKYDCPRQPCDAAFKDRWGVDRHIRAVHDKRRDYECEVCHYRFTEAYARIVHLKNPSVNHGFCNMAWLAGEVQGSPGYVPPVQDIFMDQQAYNQNQRQPQSRLVEPGINPYINSYSNQQYISSSSSQSTSQFYPGLHCTSAGSLHAPLQPEQLDPFTDAFGANPFTGASSPYPVQSPRNQTLDPSFEGKTPSLAMSYSQPDNAFLISDIGREIDGDIVSHAGQYVAGSLEPEPVQNIEAGSGIFQTGLLINCHIGRSYPVAEDEPWNEEEWQKSLEDDDPLEAWTKVIFKGA
ncbi:hypothetical protein BKA61DRAFT_680130 [Leptodontidium sp. MPI-SDFR-AT-0119]|nr:hypothetical protein BKA61DRAFT_680130 [Leptodontidium sp. MPI-SDFR-AT-0119]